MSRKAEGFSPGDERCALKIGLQVHLIVSAIELLHRLLMFLGQFQTRIGEELFKAKNLSESAKPWTELQRHTTCTKWIGDVAESQTLVIAKSAKSIFTVD